MKKFFQSNRDSQKFMDETEESFEKSFSREFYILNKFLFDCQTYTFTK